TNTIGVGDVVNVDETGETDGNIGFLTSTRIWGLGMPGSTETVNGITYGAIEFLNVNLGSGDDTFNVHSAHAGLTTVRGLDGNDTFNVGSLTPALGGVVDGVAGLLILDGGNG